MNGGVGKMMKQLQKVQARIARVQEELAEKTVESSSGGGAVRVQANGQKEILSIQIDPEVLGDKEMLEDLVVSAVNGALKQVDEMVASEMQKITGGLNLPPGMF